MLTGNLLHRSSIRNNSSYFCLVADHRRIEHEGFNFWLLKLGDHIDIEVGKRCLDAWLFFSSVRQLRPDMKMTRLIRSK
jgi:hypothetical protein